MILANYAQQNRNCVREWGRGFTNPFSQFKPQLFASFYTPDTIQIDRDKSAFNHGYNTHSAWFLAPKSGGVASTLNIVGSGSATGDLLAVKLFEAALTGDGSTTAIGSLIVQAIAAITGTGTITDAQVNAFLAAVAALSGSGGVTTANISGLGEAVASILGSGTASGSTATGVAAAVAALTVTGTGLSTANVGEAVWAALAAANNTAGTMGEKLNDAGSASNPWTEVIESGFTAAEILRLIVASTAGSATNMTTAPVFKSLDGSKDRIVSTVVSNNRNVTSRDVT